MKHLYLHYLDFRRWLRRMGSSPEVSRAARVLVAPPDSKEFLDYIKIAIGVMGIISMWLIFLLHSNGPIEVKPTTSPLFLSAPADPEKVEVISF